MQILRPFLLLLVGAALPAWGQSAPQPMDLKVPADALPAQHASAEPAKDADAANPETPDPMQLAVPYEETYGMRRDAARSACDDRTYGQPQVHGSVGMGVGAGTHTSENYQVATIAVTKALGSCDDQKGLIGASISVGQSSYNGRRGGRP